MKQVSINQIRSVNDLNALRDSVKKDMKKLGSEIKERVLVCTGGGCIASGSLKVRDALIAAIREQGLEDTVAVVETGCLGPCALGPVILMEKDDIFYQEVKPEDAKDIIEQHGGGKNRGTADPSERRKVGARQNGNRLLQQTDENRSSQLRTNQPRPH